MECVACLSKKKKKIRFFCPDPLTPPPENTIIGLTLETMAKTEFRGQKPARLLGRLKESEMCLVTAQENFLEV